MAERKSRRVAAVKSDRQKHATERAWDREHARSEIARVIIRWSALLIVVFGAGGIGLAVYLREMGQEVDVMDAAGDVQHALFPMVSAWIGGVLAFYFVNRTAEEGGRTAREALRQRTFSETVRATPIVAVMRTMPEVEFVEIELDPDGSPTNRLSEVIGVLKAGKTRIPLFEWNAKGKFFILRHVLHESTVFEFLARRGAANSEEIPLAELLSDPTTRARLDGTLALVPQRAALADAKVVMDANRRIQDVAVTLNGGAEEAFIGWLTNVDVLRHCIAGAGVLDDEG